MKQIADGRTGQKSKMGRLVRTGIDGWIEAWKPSISPTFAHPPHPFRLFDPGFPTWCIILREVHLI